MNEFKQYDINFLNNFGKYNSKKSYEVFRMKYEKKP